MSDYPQSMEAWLRGKYNNAVYAKKKWLENEPRWHRGHQNPTPAEIRGFERSKAKIEWEVQLRKDDLDKFLDHRKKKYGR